MKIEIEHVVDSPTIYSGGIWFREAHVNLIDNGIRYNNLCLKIIEEADGDYLDFTKTRFKELGKIQINEEENK